jgi:hypothetical protein
MNNYQLYRTNLLLGGQMKWDLIVNKVQNTLCVSDFHLSPISNNTPYMHKPDEYLIKNKHQDNVVAYYKSNKGYFYNENLNTEFSHNYPIIGDSTTGLYSNIYDKGCKRASYNKYNKQFEFFCPLWLEHVTDPLKFVISIKNVKSKSILASTVLTLDNNDNANTEYHNKFVTYFNNYLNDAGIKSGNDNIINISFDNNTSAIFGMNVESGLFETKTDHNLVNNLTSRERSLIENDNILITSFMNNNLICGQLFNFNLCFNLSDILSEHIVNMLYGENFIVEVDVKMGNDELVKADFNTGYEFINKDVKYSNLQSDKYNVLDYFHDYECVDLIDKNKFCQSICHWVLNDNHDYIFNVYDGFAGILAIEDNKYCENDHMYGNTPNILLKVHDETANSAGWFNNYKTSLWGDFYKYIKNTNANKADATHFNGDTFINGIKYSASENIGLYLIGLVVTNTSDLLALILESFNNWVCITPNADTSKVYALYKDDLIILITTNYNNFAFSNFYDILHAWYEDDNADKTDMYLCDKLSKLYNMMGSAVKQSIVYLDKSLKYVNAKSPNVLTTEVEYYKDDTTYNYVLRYDGKIKPMFVSKPDVLYYKEQLTENDINNSVYSKYGNYEYEPLYPSIGYCAIKKLDGWEYSNYPNELFKNECEYSWFDTNRCLALSPVIKFVSYNDNLSIDDIIKTQISKFYKTSNKDTINYILSLYTYANDWNYTDNNISNMVYNIVLKLK